MVARVMTPSKEEHMTDVVEVMARALDPDIFKFPRINLNKARYDDAFECARAALAVLNEAGYAVGPLNATLEMCRAGHQSDLLGCDIPDDECEMYYSRVYAAMLSAAQPAPK